VTTLQEIETAIARLPRGAFFELVRHLRERHSDEWDRQIDEDAKSGKLDLLYDRLKKEDGTESTVSLDDFLDNEKLS
jgi:hypothetical protein